MSGFVQDLIALPGDKVRITVGTKLEHNDFSGYELQPSARIAFTPHRAHVVWGAVSRAVRVPTLIERDVAIDVSNPGDVPFVRLLGNPAFSSEKPIAYELGYRWQVAPCSWTRPASTTATPTSPPSRSGRRSPSPAGAWSSRSSTRTRCTDAPSAGRPP